ncbi:MAG: MFS transporter [Pseudomonadota bacterium]
MSTASNPAAGAGTPQTAGRTAFSVLFALSLCHLLNDTIQSLLPAIYPVLQVNYALSYTEIGIIHFAFQVTACLLQPGVGLYTDRRPMFRLAAIGMGASLIGLILIAHAGSFWFLVIAAMCVGLGSAVFHPESSRNARAASGGKYGLGQSIFQVGGNAGTALGPLLAAFVVLPLGQPSVVWFGALALLAMIVLWRVGSWAKARHAASGVPRRTTPPPISRRVVLVLCVLGVLTFSKFIYLASLTSYYTFYLIEKFDVSVRDSQLFLFVFLGAVAAGTFAGGPIGDRYGRRLVMVISILGTLPFTLMLPHANLFWTAALSFLIGVVNASAFSAIVVYGQSLLPGRVGLLSGLFFGFAFGIAGIGAAVLGVLADATSIGFVFQVCAFLPALGVFAFFLPPERHSA